MCIYSWWSMNNLIWLFILWRIHLLFVLIVWFVCRWYPHNQLEMLFVFIHSFCVYYTARGNNELTFIIHCIVSILRLRQNGRHFADDIFKCIFLNENVWIPIKISLKFVPQVPINNIPGLVQIMAWRRSGDKPLSGPIMVRLPTHICVTRPQWVKYIGKYLKRHRKWMMPKYSID